MKIMRTYFGNFRTKLMCCLHDGVIFIHLIASYNRLIDRTIDFTVFRRLSVLLCHVPRQNSSFGDRSFAAAGPRTWNELSFSLRDTGSSLTTFNEHLKTYLFFVAF